MLTFLGFAMIATFLVLIMMKKMSPIAALVLIPALFCVFAGQGAHLGDYVIDGVGKLAPTAAMLMFAIVYFGVMIDVGLFDPIVRGILRFCKADPMRVVVGTAVLAAIVSLDGDGSTTFMITVSAMYPLYKRLGLSLVVMTGVAATANGVMNTLPWGGPTARAATALKVDAADIFVPMIPALATGLLFVFVLAYVLGLKERRRVGVLALPGTEETAARGTEKPTEKPTGRGAEEATEGETGKASGADAPEGLLVAATATAGSEPAAGSGPATLHAGPAGTAVTVEPSRTAGTAGTAVTVEPSGPADAADPSGLSGQAGVPPQTAPAGVGSAAAASAAASAAAPAAPQADADTPGGGFQGLDPDRATLRPRLYWFNAGLTVALLTAMITELLPIPVLFLLGAALALTVNFPHMPDQKARIAAHADNVLNVTGMVFAAAVFTGVLSGTGMVKHMADWLVGAIPEGMGPHMALVTGVLSLPLTYFMSNDGFYFGVLPVLAEAGAAHGVSPLQIARASIAGQALHMSSPLVPAVYVLVGMAKVEFGDHTRFTVKWAALTSLVVLGAGMLFGII